MKWIFLSLSVAFNMMSYILYKSIAHRNGDILWLLLFSAGLIFGAINTFFFTRALRTLNLSIAYPVFSAACIALMMVTSGLLFHEKISPVNMAGIAVITAGIVLATR